MNFKRTSRIGSYCTELLIPTSEIFLTGTLLTLREWIGRLRGHLEDLELLHRGGRDAKMCYTFYQLFLKSIIKVMSS